MKFRLDLSQFEAFKKKILLRVVPLLATIIIVILFINQSTWEVMAILAVMFMSLLIFTVRNSIKRQRRAWETFELTITDEGVERVQEGFPLISVLKSDIVEAVEGTDGTITLKTKRKANSVIIPSSIENREEFVKLISTFTIIRPLQNKNTMLITYGSALLGLVLYLLHMYTTNRLVVTISGLTILIILIINFIQIQRNRNINIKVKRYSWFTIILLLTVVLRLFAAWSTPAR